MAFGIIGLIYWTYYLAGDVKSAGDMFCGPFLLVLAILFFYVLFGARPSERASRIYGALVLVGAVNGSAMFVLDGLAPYIMIPLHFLWIGLLLFGKVMDRRIQAAPTQRHEDPWKAAGQTWHEAEVSELRPRRRR